MAYGVAKVLLFHATIGIPQRMTLVLGSSDDNRRKLIAAYLFEVVANSNFNTKPLAVCVCDVERMQKPQSSVVGAATWRLLKFLLDRKPVLVAFYQLSYQTVLFILGKCNHFPVTVKLHLHFKLHLYIDVRHGDDKLSSYFVIFRDCDLDLASERLRNNQLKVALGGKRTRGTASSRTCLQG